MKKDVIRGTWNYTRNKPRLMTRKERRVRRKAVVGLALKRMLKVIEGGKCNDETGSD